MLGKLDIKNKYLYGLVVWTIFVVVTCLMPMPKTPQKIRIFEHTDKVVHLVYYFVFTFLFLKYLENDTKNYLQRKAVVVACTVAVSLGITIEILQQYVTKTRSADAFDVIFNALGTIVAVCFYKIVKEKRKY